MPYFPTHKESQYRCPSCGGYYYRGSTVCLVLHPPGTCCHEYEQPAPTPVAPYPTELR